MASIFHIIRDELERLKEAQRAYEAAIKAEEQGAPQVKHIGRKDYLYLAQRKGARVIYHYVGNTGSRKAQEVLESISRRRQYQQLLRGVKGDLKEVRKALRGKV